MPATQTSYEHIIIDENGNPTIAGTTMKVVELVVEKEAHGWSAEELWFQHPYLTLGKIYSALAYYADHREKLDADIQDGLREVDALARKSPRPPFLDRLKLSGLR